ncbi:unnamed protein product [Adineta steineri]|uniref:G-protein coupled receptors family 1 profile domain-containing protein n=2 Tax=Adineta steineri TaxID=433720 RepID=A0A813NWN6_9BILA|nr:unnamed protein product [Adineta steineri]
MSSPSTNTASVDIDVIEAVKYNTILFVEVWSFVIFFLGTVGHILSIYVFTRRSLRSNACSQYFLASAVAGLGVVYINIPLRFLQSVFNIDVFASSDVMCRILNWLLNWIKATPLWIVVLACADRFLSSSSSATTRGWSSTRVVIPATSVMIFLVGLSYIHLLIYSRGIAGPVCIILPGTYRVFNNIFNLIVFVMGPSSSMLIFGLLTIRNIRQTVKRVLPNNIPIQAQPQSQNILQQGQKATDRQLIQMMLMQCTFFILTSSPNVVYFFYSTAISDGVVSALQAARLNMFMSMANYVALTGPCMSFYIFTLSSQLFRRELILLFRHLWRTIQGN